MPVASPVSLDQSPSDNHMDNGFNTAVEDAAAAVRENVLQRQNMFGKIAVMVKKKSVEFARTLSNVPEDSPAYTHNIHASPTMVPLSPVAEAAIADGHPIPTLALSSSVVEEHTQILTRPRPRPGVPQRAQTMSMFSSGASPDADERGTGGFLKGLIRKTSGIFSPSRPKPVRSRTWDETLLPKALDFFGEPLPPTVVPKVEEPRVLGQRPPVRRGASVYEEEVVEAKVAYRDELSRWEKGREGRQKIAQSVNNWLTFNDPDFHFNNDRHSQLVLSGDDLDELVDLNGFPWPPSVQGLKISGGKLTTLDLSRLPHLRRLDISNTNIRTLRGSSSTLETLVAKEDVFSVIDLSHFVALKYAGLQDNKIGDIIFPSTPARKQNGQPILQYVRLEGSSLSLLPQNFDRLHPDTQVQVTSKTILADVLEQMAEIKTTNLFARPSRYAPPQLLKLDDLRPVRPRSHSSEEQAEMLSIPDALYTEEGATKFVQFLHGLDLSQEVARTKMANQFQARIQGIDLAKNPEKGVAAFKSQLQAVYGMAEGQALFDNYVRTAAYADGVIRFENEVQDAYRMAGVSSFEELLQRIGPEKVKAFAQEIRDIYPPERLALYKDVAGHETQLQELALGELQSLFEKILDSSAQRTGRVEGIDLLKDLSVGVFRGADPAKLVDGFKELLQGEGTAKLGAFFDELFQDAVLQKAQVWFRQKVRTSRPQDVTAWFGRVVQDERRADLKAWLDELAQDPELRRQTFAGVQQADLAIEDPSQVYRQLSALRNVRDMNMGKYDQARAELIALARRDLGLERAQDMAEPVVGDDLLIDYMMHKWLPQESGADAWDRMSERLEPHPMPLKMQEPLDLQKSLSPDDAKTLRELDSSDVIELIGPSHAERLRDLEKRIAQFNEDIVKHNQEVSALNDESTTLARRRFVGKRVLGDLSASI